MAGEEGATISRLLVVRTTRAMLDLVTAYPDVIGAAYPATAQDAHRALCGETEWPGPALLWADVSGGSATIRSTPPRGVRVGS